MNDAKIQDPGPRVPFEQLSQPDGEVYEWQGQPFTGTAYILDDQARLVCEIAYRDGAQRLWARDWDPESAQLRSESTYTANSGSGLRRDWHPLTTSGQAILAAETEHEHGIVTRRRRWDSAGALLEDYTLPEDDIQFERLARMRRLYGT